MTIGVARLHAECIDLGHGSEGKPPARGFIGERRAAKELLHVKAWLDRVDEIVERGKDAYLADDLLQEAGDSLMTVALGLNPFLYQRLAGVYFDAVIREISSQAATRSGTRACLASDTNASWTISSGRSVHCRA